MTIRRARGTMACFMVMILFTIGNSPTAMGADVVIGVGNSAKIHYYAGRAVCREVGRAVKGMSCEAQEVEGGDAAEPVAVLSSLANAAMEMGIVQSDWQHHAVKGTGPFKFVDVKFDNLRAMFSLHSEPFTLIARRDSGINGLDDLPGKRVNLGTPGSPEREMMKMVMTAKGWTRKTFQYVDELSGSEQSLALCHNRVQAIISTAAHPNRAVAQAIDLCDAKIVEISGPKIDKLIADNNFLAKTTVPGGLYKGMDKPVNTFGIKVVAMSSSDMEDDLIYTVVKSVFDRFDRFKRSHRSLGSLSPQRMTRDGITAPLHPGALRYFREKGMM